MTQNSLPKPLQQLVDRYEIDSSSGFILAMMELAYQAGEKHAWGESSQEPALFMGEKPQENLTFPQLDSIWFDELTTSNEDPTYTLSQPDVNYLRPFLSALASQVQQELAKLKEDEQFFYEHASPDNPIGERYFKCLNHTRNEIRRLKKHQQRIDGIIRQFKYGN